MSPYRYRAARADGAVVVGIVDATTAWQANATLTERGLFPVAIAPADPSERRSARRQDLALVFRSIAALVTGGVPLERAVAATELLAPASLKETLADARAALRRGQEFAQALAASRGVVPRVVVGMIRAGERGSQLGQALEQVADHLEQEAELVARVRQALAYPALLTIVGIASMLMIGTVIVPKFAELLGDLGEDLPVSTRMLIGASTLATHYWPLGVLCLTGAVWVVREVLRRPAARRQVEDTLLSLPFVGPLRHALATTRVARALGGMLQSGMPLLPALVSAGEAAGDLAVARRMGVARERVAQGAALTAALDHESALLPSALQLFAVGESSGRLGEMALRAGDLAGREAERGLKTLITLLEPALIVTFGGLVAFVAAALLQAVYAIRPGGL